MRRSPRYPRDRPIPRPVNPYAYYWGWKYSARNDARRWALGRGFSRAESDLAPE